MTNKNVRAAIILGGLLIAVIYLLIPKYELRSSEDGTLVYRFNKVTGKIESYDENGQWHKAYYVKMKGQTP